MKIIVVGTGFVGLCHAAVCSEYGHEVYAYDINPVRIAAYQTGKTEEIERFINEPGLPAVIAENLNRYLFTTDVTSHIEGTDAIFLCLPTPPNPDGSSDLSCYFTAVEYLAELLAKRVDQRRVVVINKSTVPIGTARALEGVLNKHNVPNVGVASNPNFCPKVMPSRNRAAPIVWWWAPTPMPTSVFCAASSQFVNHVRIRYIETTPETAEAIKYVANTLLLTYVSFWNGVGARLGKTFPNVRMEDLKRGVTADGRIARWGSYVGIGAGGSCFGKDVQSLIYAAVVAHHDARMLQSVYDINEYQKVYLLDRAEHEAEFSFANKTVAVLGIAFKQRTNDIREFVGTQSYRGLAGAWCRRYPSLRSHGDGRGSACV
jgi:UDPglucose 6-dehydrogenase